jgi:NAD(P)-dependent dehydrogenase (short-subunit alcohol dehydrogenase family)
MRALLAGRGVRVHAVLTGPVDTVRTEEIDSEVACQVARRDDFWRAEQFQVRRGSAPPSLKEASR